MQSNTLLFISNLAVIASVWLLVAHEFSRSPSAAPNSYLTAPNPYVSFDHNQKDVHKLEKDVQNLEEQLRALSKYFKTTRKELGRMKCEKALLADPKGVGDSGGYCMWNVQEKFLSVGGNGLIDMPLAKAIEQYLAGKSIYDFGCGVGRYGGFWLHDDGVPATFPWKNESINPKPKLIKSWAGYDGSEGIEEVTDGFVNFLDLSVPAWMPPADWVVSLEVGEHVPKEFQDTLLENLDRHNTEGIILSWAVRGQGGRHHVNNLDNHEVIALVEKLGPGYTYDKTQSEAFKSVAVFAWFQNTVMVFKKNRG